MLETPHVVIGAAIATKVVNPWLSLPLAFASHFVFERVPHWNPHLNTEIKTHGRVTKQSTYIVLLDVFLSLIVGIYIAQRALPDVNRFLIILLACFLSVLPDVIEGPYFFLKVKNKFIDNWIKFQKSLQNDTTVIPGLITQLITIIAGLWWILN